MLSSGNLAAPAFHFNSLTDYLAQSAEIADDFVAGWSETLAANNGVVEVMNQAANLTANILLKSVFSYDAKTTVRRVPFAPLGRPLLTSVP